MLTNHTMEWEARHYLYTTTPPLHGRLDVVVYAKEICRVVGVLERDEPLVLLCAVGHPQPGLLLLITAPVQVASPGGKRLQG